MPQDRNDPPSNDASELDPSALQSVPPSGLDVGAHVAPIPKSPRALRSVAPALPRDRSVAPLPPPAKPTPPWQPASERLEREIEARKAQNPARAALFSAARACILQEAMSETGAAESALEQAAKLAPNARFVAAAKRWRIEKSDDAPAMLQAARDELEHVGEGRERTALLWQVAAIEEHVAGDAQAAMRTMRELLELDPSDLGALEALGALHLELRRRGQGKASDEVVFGGVVEALERISGGTEDAVIRSALQGAVGALRDRYLPDVDAALAWLRRALESDQANAGAQATLEAVLLRRRAWDEYARSIMTQAARTAEALPARELYERAGDIYADCIHDLPQAAHCYDRAAALAASDPGPVEKLVRVLEAAGRWTETAEGCERLLARTFDPIARAWVFVRLAALYESKLQRPDDAFANYRLAVEAHPVFAPAVQGLLRMCRERRLPLAIELERREADRIVDRNVRGVRYAALAETAATLGSAGEAAALYERALGLDPSNAAAFEALDRTYRQAQQWPELIALYEGALAEAEQRAHPRRLRSLRLQLADLLHDRAGDPARAATLRREALKGPEDRYDVLVSLARALGDANDWAGLVEVLEEQASMLEGSDRIAALYRAASTLESRVNDRERALATYEKLLAEAPRHEAAARAVSRIHEHEGRWERVIRAERKLLDLATRPEDILEGLVRIAKISEEQLGRGEDAVGAYLEALYISPTHAPVIAALSRLLQNTGDFQRLAQVLDRYADTTPDLHRKVRARIRAAIVLELCLDEGKAAADSYARALTDLEGAKGEHTEADRHAALWGLLRIQEARSEWQAVEATLLRILEATTDRPARKRVLVRLARNRELRLNDVPRASKLYEQAVAMGAGDAKEPSASPEPGRARDAVESSIAAMAVDRVRVARLEGKRDAIANSLAAMAACTSDVRLENGLLRVLALANEHGGARGRAKAAPLYERLVARDAEDPQALEGVIRCLPFALPAASASSAASAVPSPREPSDPRVSRAMLARAVVTRDSELQTLLAFSAAMLDESNGRDEAAASAYDVALATDPDFLPALDGMRRLRTRARDWPSVAALAERTAHVALDRPNVAEAWLTAASTYEKQLADPARALASYRALLDVQPGHVAALERAFPLLDAVGDHANAARMLLAHVDARADEPAAQAHWLARRAEILAGPLEDPAGAIADLERAIPLVDDDHQLLRLLQTQSALEERRRAWQEALGLYERIATLGSPAAARDAHLARARIYGNELRDHARAEEILEAVVAEGPDDREARFRLAEVAQRTGHVDRAHELYAGIAGSERAAGTERIRALVATADLHLARRDAASKTAADAALARAFDLAIADASLLPPLVERFTKGDPRGFVLQAEAAIARVRANTPGVLPLRTETARMLREKLGDPGAADRQLAAAIHSFPESMATRLTLSRALLGRNDEEAFAELRRAIAFDALAPGPYEALAMLSRSTGRGEVSGLLASAAALLGSSSPEVEATILGLQPTAPQPNSLGPDVVGRLIGHSQARFVRAVLPVLDPFLPALFPGGDAILGTRTRLGDKEPAVVDARAIAAALGCAPPAIYRGNGSEVQLVLSEPRAIVLGRDLLVGTARANAYFYIACACARIAVHGSIHAAPRAHVAALIEAAVLPETDANREFKKRLRSALPRKTRKDLERLAEAGVPDLKGEVAAWEAEEARRALYTGIVLARDMRPVADVLAPDAMALPQGDARRQALANNALLREILEFAASMSCWNTIRIAYGRG